MLATLGDFIFEISTAPYQQLQRATQWRWSSNDRVGQRAASQYLGPGEDAITLTGSLVPEITGGNVNLHRLRAMANSGEYWGLIDGQGYYYGQYRIDSINETRENMMDNGQAKKTEFSISLQRVDNISWT